MRSKRFITDRLPAALPFALRLECFDIIKLYLGVRAQARRKFRDLQLEICIFRRISARFVEIQWVFARFCGFL